MRKVTWPDLWKINLQDYPLERMEAGNCWDAAGLAPWVSVRVQAGKQVAVKLGNLRKINKGNITQMWA